MRLFFLFVFTILLTINVHAKPASGCFKAAESCEAYQSFRKKTNPEGIYLKPGNFYAIEESSKKNKAFRIRVEGIKRPLRWVAKRCGERRASCGSKVTSANKLKARKETRKETKKVYNRVKPKKHTNNLLALTWQPSFCETHSRKKECRSQTKNRYDASHWSLHGLWPQPRGNAYCGVSDMDKGIDRNKKWHLLEPPKLSSKTATELAFIMPAMVSNLHRHEWVKHGTCYGTNADTYYSDAISLTKQINESIVGKLFNKGVGKRVTLKQVRQHFDKAFGKGAGDKVDMRCDRKGRVSELWINLKGKISADTKMASLLKNSLRAGTTCTTGLIDAVD